MSKALADHHRERAAEAKARIGHYEFKIRCARWTIACEEAAAEALEKGETPKNPNNNPQLDATWKSIMGNIT